MSYETKPFVKPDYWYEGGLKQRPAKFFVFFFFPVKGKVINILSLVSHTGSLFVFILVCALVLQHFKNAKSVLSSWGSHKMEGGPHVIYGPLFPNLCKTFSDMQWSQKCASCSPFSRKLL